ncbi:MAG: VOC family protein [bacterium]
MSFASLLAILLVLSVFFLLAIAIMGVVIFYLLRSKPRPTVAQKADHVAYQVSDLKKAVDFYTDQLGLNLLSTNIDEDHHEAFAFVELDGCNLELLQMLDEDNKPLPMLKKEISPPYCPHFAIKTDDMDKLVRMLREKGIPIVKGPLEIPGSVRWIYLHDPDNNVIEFVQWL